MTHQDNGARGKVNVKKAQAAVGFRTRVLELVALLPPGQLATYGQLALVAGRPGAARQVGRVLRGLSSAEAESLPWQRVVNAQGGISTYKVGTGELQRALLEREGVAFSARGCCDLTRYRYTFGAVGAFDETD